MALRDMTPAQRRLLRECFPGSHAALVERDRREFEALLERTRALLGRPAVASPGP